MSNSVTVAQILQHGAPAAIAISAPDRPDLTFAGLRTQVARTAETLNRFGLGRGDRIAIVLPNGPEMAVTFLASAGDATAAPLNPAYRSDEFDFYLTDLCAKAVIVQAGMDSPVREVARNRGIPLLTLTPSLTEPAGRFTLAADLRGAPAAGGDTEADETALVLHTSGTTSRPKIVPLTQRNLCASAHHIRDTLRLSDTDRCLNLMPLFHIHGLMAALLAALSAGGSVHCCPGFNALKVFAWMAEARPTWYTAVPTMHQAILARADRHADHHAALLADTRLRFIRSSSSSLPPQTMAEIERLFRAPMIESYGMTEAAHQMTSNPLPPRERKPGSVGTAAGPEVAIMDAAGNLLEPGVTGEIVIRGPNVTLGYEANPQANAEAFANGWFRTGDQGVFDAGGYLRLTGRLKEIINRGGEKISPREVDEVLMDHPAVAQAVTFALPHEKLGEEVAAAVVLRDGAAATERDLRSFVAERLADFKVPRRVLILDEIPKGPTGKLQRIGLAQRLGLAL